MSKVKVLDKLKCELAEQIIMSWFTDAEYSKYGQYVEELKQILVKPYLNNHEQINLSEADGFYDVLEYEGQLIGKISILRYINDEHKLGNFSIHRTGAGIELLPDGDIISFLSFFGIAPKLNVSQDQIYVISTEDGTRSKVGVSKHPDKRLKELQTGSPFKLELKFTTFTGKYKAYDIEKMIHALFDDTRTTGEWFHSASETIIKKIKSILE